MFVLHCLVFYCLFVVSIPGCCNCVGYNDSVRFSLRCLRLCSYTLNIRRCPPAVKLRGLFVLLILCGDISLNPGPISFGFANCRSVRNKGALIADTIATNSLDMLAACETHIKHTDTDYLIRSITPPGFKLFQSPRPRGGGGGVGLFLRSEVTVGVIDIPVYTSFESIAISTGNCSQHLTIASIYRPPGACTSLFMDEFMSFVSVLSSRCLSFIICGDFNFHVDTDCSDRVKFYNLIDCCDLHQHVTQPTHLHGHTLDLLLTPSDSEIISHVNVGQFISDHAFVKCHINLSCPLKAKPNKISYRCYHKIDMNDFRADLLNCNFVRHPDVRAAGLYDQYCMDMGLILDKHAPLVTKHLVQRPAGWLTESYKAAKALHRQYERTWRRNKTSVNRSRLLQEYCQGT